MLHLRDIKKIIIISFGILIFSLGTTCLYSQEAPNQQQLEEMQRRLLQQQTAPQQRPPTQSEFQRQLQQRLLQLQQGWPQPGQAQQQVPQPLANQVAQNQAAQQRTQQMVQSNPATQAHVLSASDQAFAGVVQNLLPMNTDQIRSLRQVYESAQHAAAAVGKGGTPPRPTATSQIVNLAPGSTPPVIRLAAGFVSSLVFLDSSGSPWPIEAYDLGNPSAFNIQWDKKGNTLMIQANSLFTYGNLAVKLRKLSTPVMITLIPGQKAVDYRVDLRIQGYGPNAKALPTGDGLPGKANPTLLGVLDGVPPPGGRELTISGGTNSRAWMVGGMLYIRTRLHLLSPGWISKMVSADGMQAYELHVTPMILVAQNGQAVQLKLEGL